MDPRVEAELLRLVPVAIDEDGVGLVLRHPFAGELDVVFQVQLESRLLSGHGQLPTPETRKMAESENGAGVVHGATDPNGRIGARLNDFSVIRPRRSLGSESRCWPG